MPEPLRILAGGCTVTDEDADRREERGTVVALPKPDNRRYLLVGASRCQRQGRFLKVVWVHVL